MRWTPKKIHLFTAFAGEEPQGIPDPFGGNAETFRMVRDRLIVLSKKIVEEIHHG